MTTRLNDLQEAVDLLLQRIPGTLRIGAPLGIGKPHRLLNALYERIEKDPSRRMEIYTALSLDPPAAAPGLERRFLQPFAPHGNLHGAVTGSAGRRTRPGAPFPWPLRLAPFRR